MTHLLKLPALAFAAVAITLGGASSAHAAATTQPATTTATPAPTAGHHHHKHHGKSVLTDAERQQMHAARKAALAANPALKQEKHALKKQYRELAKSGDSKDQLKALHAQKKALREKTRSAELLIDPSLKPIFAKIDAAKAGHKHKV